MPEYKFKNNKTDKEWIERMSISELDKFLEDNKHVVQLVHGSPMIVTGVASKRSKPDDGFRDMLKQIKKSNSRGIRRSTINTF